MKYSDTALTVSVFAVLNALNAKAESHGVTDVTHGFFWENECMYKCMLPSTYDICYTRCAVIFYYCDPR